MNNVRLAKVNDLAQSFVHSRLNGACNRVKKLRKSLVEKRLDEIKKKAQSFKPKLEAVRDDINKLEVEHRVINAKANAADNKALEEFRQKQHKARQKREDAQEKAIEKHYKVREKIENLLAKLGVEEDSGGYRYGWESELREFKIGSEKWFITDAQLSNVKCQIEELKPLKTEREKAAKLRDTYHRILMNSWSITDPDDFKAYVIEMNQVKKDAEAILPELDEDSRSLI